MDKKTDRGGNSSFGLDSLVGKAGVFFGVVKEVPDDLPKDQTGGNGSGNFSGSGQPSIPISSLPPTNPPLPTTEEVSNLPNPPSDDVEGQATHHAEKDLTIVLQATPSNFRDYLEKKATLLATLSQAGLSGSALEETASKSALQMSKLTSADVKRALAEAKHALQNLRSDFASKVEQKRQHDVVAPNHQIESILNQITSLRSQLISIQNQIKVLEASVGPSQEAIQKASDNLKRAERIFERSSDKVAESLAAIEQQLLNHLGH